MSTDEATATPSRRRIMVVEDQAALRTLVTATLERAGFDVAAHANAPDALADFSGWDPDALLADINLDSRPNGVELATILRARAPYLGVIFLTAYPAHLAFKKTIPPPEGYAFLQKEQLESVETLTTVIESALDDSQMPIRCGAAEADPLAYLTHNQLEVIRLIAAGWSNAEIAEERNTTVRSLERLITRTFDNLGLSHFAGNSRVAAANMYTKKFGHVDLEMPMR
jgi:DNA-binding NarL/FixJ family response regulator